MSTTDARYDPHADWYETWVHDTAGHTDRVRSTATELLGPGPGRLLDLGCGTGVHASAFTALGWGVIGVDESVGQLAHARARLPVARADVTRLPVRDGALDAVVGTHVHTDIDDWDAACAEVARVLRPGGQFAYVGTHPCFTAAFAERRADGTVLVCPGYRRRERVFTGPGLSPHGIRARVGTVHLPLPDLLAPLVAPPFRLLRLVEPAGPAVPELFGFVAIRE